MKDGIEVLIGLCIVVLIFLVGVTMGSCFESERKPTVVGLSYPSRDRKPAWSVQWTMGFEAGQQAVRDSVAAATTRRPYVIERMGHFIVFTGGNADSFNTRGTDGNYYAGRFRRVGP